MARTRAVLRGRDEELAVLRTALTADGGRLVVLLGPAGSGRTAVLDEVERLLGAAGTRVLPIRPGAGPDGGDDGDDAFALAPLVRTVRDRFEQFPEGGPADELAAVARLSEAAERDGGGWRPSMITTLGDLFDRIGRQGRTAILADDAHAIAEPAPLLTAARRSGLTVLATCETSARHAPGAAELLALADQVVTLGPLADDAAESLARRAQGARLDEAVPDLLRGALGPLFGNPGTVLNTLADLRERGRLTVFRGRLCLRAPSEPIELPAGHPLLRRVAALGEPAGRLLSAVAVWDGVGVSDLPLLAEVIGARLADCGRALDELIDAEVLVADPAGRVSCRCPALAASAAASRGDQGGAALHAEIARRLLAEDPLEGGAGSAALADHIALGGPAVTLDAPRVTRLLGLAAGAEAEQPERAAGWYAAALRHLPPGEPEHARTLYRLLDLVLRTGRYELLRDVLARAAEQGLLDCSARRGGPDRPPEPGRAAVGSPLIRLAAVVAALHSGEPPAGEPALSVLDEGITGREPMGFAPWWFGRPPAPGGEPGGREADTPDGSGGPGGPGGPDASDSPDASDTSDASCISEVSVSSEGSPAPGIPAGAPNLLPAGRLDLLTTALAGDPGAFERAWRRSGRSVPSAELGRLHRAAAVADIATVARLVLGDRYRVPETGVLGVYRRVVRGYARADWSQAMSAARELELSYPGETLAHQGARLFAAEICAARGETRQAAQWLDDAEPAPGLVVMRAWVRIGLLSHAGAGRRVPPLVRRLSGRLRREGVVAGLDLLLMRAVRIAAFTDDHQGAASLLEEIELARRDLGTEAAESLALARGLVRRDLRQARRAAELARRRGDLPSLLCLCLVVARFAEDPRPWLREAHALATQCDASVPLAHVRAVTRERGVPAPRARGRREDSAVTERRIVELIGEGLTNRQIALRLRISEKTVENHLTRLFARTGVRSRVELAAVSLGGRLTRTVT
ncbi:helix-turn-helix transcriptional regulator [Streptomyces zingiberis]|uniref:Helix-turn-helix domain-containing protein n=1 Tax=Streptomyces zingiberis TaxID=2053010 RepID=A0ABX1C339_9ACTN|nr:LuxR family transcriptional regulator [Streptomyces zingiberis]NJQ02545.1 helix-turn-helix domain-containing protein [Streptomyces zingiberis]